MPEIDQFGAPVDEELHPFGQRVELAQQGDPRRLQRGAQRPLGSGALVRSRGVDQRTAAAVDFVVVDIEFAGEQLQKTLAPARIERQIGAAEIGGAGARRDLAAAPVEAAQHLLAQPVGVVGGDLGPRRAGQHAARRLGDLAPRVAQIGQGSVEDAFEETGGSGIGHGGSGGLGWHRTRRENAPAVNAQKGLAAGCGKFPAAMITAKSANCLIAPPNSRTDRA